MSKSKTKKYDRRRMRRLAVSCIFDYGFLLEEKKTRLEEAAEKTVKKEPESDFVVVNKPLARGRRRTRISREEFDEKYGKVQRELEKLRPQVQPEPEEELNVEDFMQEVADVIAEENEEETVILAGLPDYDEYLYPVVTGVKEHIDEIDAIIGRNSTGWDLDRIEKMDLAILRVAVFELRFFAGKVPLEVAINEAVEISKTFHADGSGAFVNGVLAGVVREK